MTLPDTSFLYIRSGKQFFPYKDAAGRIDGALVGAAIAEIGQSELPAPIKASLMTKAKAISKRTTEAELWSYIRLSEPYARNSDLPEPVRKALPAGGQTIYRKVFNAAIVQYNGDEARAARVAWAAVKKKYKKQGETWTLKESETDMQSDIFNRIQEAVVPIVYKILLATKLRVASDRAKLANSPVEEPAAPEEKPVVESMQESYALPAEALSEVAAWEQGEERVIRNCTFIKAGLNAPKTRKWNAALLAESLECFDGSLCFIDHPVKGQPRSLRALAAHTRNPRFDKPTDSVVGDIVLLDNNEAADYVISVFGNETVRNSGAVGLSVLWEGGTFKSDFEEYGNRTIEVPVKLSGKCQVDFVANPSAHGLVGAL